MTPRARKLAAGLGIAGALLLAVVVGTRLWRGEGNRERLVASGTVEATEGHLGFQTPGRIADIRVHEGDPVRKGDTLAVQDRSELLARRRGAEARVGEARARLRELEGGFRSEEVAEGRAALAAAEERLEDARRDLDRTRRLHEGGAVSREALDKATTAFEVAASDARRARERVHLLESGPRPEAVEAQRARLAAAEADLAASQAALDDRTAVAPFGGIVTVRHREPGEVVGAGSPVLTVMNADDRWVRIYVREDRIGAVRLGRSATITSDTYTDRSYEGRVRFIASEAEFTPRNVQTTEERVKLVYAVKVQITGDPNLELKPGMPADVTLDLAPAEGDS